MFARACSQNVLAKGLKQYRNEVKLIFNTYFLKSCIYMIMGSIFPGIIQKRNKILRKGSMYTEMLNNKLSDPEFLLKKEWIIQQIKFKLKLIDFELSKQHRRSMIQKVEHRIKDAESIARKLVKKGYKITFENAYQKLNDIIGIRVVCLYRDDIYNIAGLLKQQKDMILIKEKDYIKNPKKSGYQSLHLIFDVPLTYKDTVEMQRVEIQIRTVAMDFWAGVDNHICYKKNPAKMKTAELALKNYSTEISRMDKQMLELRKNAES